MPYLIAAVVFVGALCTVDLLLTFGVIRRLREHTELLSTRAGEPGEGPGTVAVGEVPGPFTAVDTDGAEVDHRTGGAGRLVGFFSPGCEPCRTKLPDFVAYAAEFPGGRAQVLAVVSGDEQSAADFTGPLTGVARVVVDGSEGPVATAFGVNGFPAWCVQDEHGVVQHSGLGREPLPAAVPA